jgi:hypothetical protein
MDTFCWLLLAHLLGDWVLQNDWMARGKKRGLLTLAGLVHYITYTTAILLGLWFGGVRGTGPAFYLAFGGATFVSHWLIDGTNVVERWMRFFRQSHLEIVRLMVDQTLHLLVLVILTVILARV